MMLLALNFSSYNKQHEKVAQEQKAQKPPPQQQPPPAPTESEGHRREPELHSSPAVFSESLG